MLKYLLPAAAAALALVSSTGAKASEFPVVDHFCYWINNSGQILNMDSVCGLSSPAVVLPPVVLNSAAAEAAPAEDVVTQTDFLGSMRAAGYNLMVGNKQPGVSYDVWNHRTGQNYLYFIWGSSPGPGIDDRTEPEVVVQFFPADRIARADDAIAQSCYVSAGPTCGSAVLPPNSVLPTHRRWASYPGNCMFPWQSASDGSRCGARAAVIREGGS